MSVALSRITAQGQVSVPSVIRRKLGVGPGSTLEWDQLGGYIVVRRSTRFTSKDIHRALFPEGAPAARTLDKLKEGIRQLSMRAVDSLEMQLQHGRIVLRDADAVTAALVLFRAKPALGFSDCLMLELARKAGHLPLGTFDRNLGKSKGAERL